MLTILTIVSNSQSQWFRKLFSYFGPERPSVEIKTFGDFSFLHISCKPRNKKIPWRKIKKFIPEDSQILCRSDITLPIKYNFRRFYAKRFHKILCKNAVLDVLSTANLDPSKLTISVYDPNASNFDIICALLPFSHQIRVVTNQIDRYTPKCDHLMEEFGVSLIVSNELDRLYPADILVAPDKICNKLPIKNYSLVFTSSRNAVPLHGIVYYDYKVLAPAAYAEACPRELEPEYFLAALHELCGISDLENISPHLCVCDGKVADIQSIAHCLSSLVNPS